MFLEVSHQSWALTGAPPRDPTDVFCHGDPATLGLQGESLHVLQQILDRVDDEMAQPKDLVLVLGGCWVGQPAGFPSSSALRQALQQMGQLIPCSKHGRISCSHVFGSAHSYLCHRVSSTVLPRLAVGATLPSAAAGKRQGKISCSSDLRDGLYHLPQTSLAHATTW